MQDMYTKNCCWNLKNTYIKEKIFYAHGLGDFMFSMAVRPSLFFTHSL